MQCLRLEKFQEEPVRAGVVGQFAPDARVGDLPQHIGLVGDVYLVPKLSRLLQQGGMRIAGKFHPGELGHAGLNN